MATEVVDGLPFVVRENEGGVVQEEVVGRGNAVGRKAKLGGNKMDANNIKRFIRGGKGSMLFG